VIEITVRGSSAARVDLETAEVSVYHRSPIHSLELSVESPKTAGQSNPITVRAYDAENRPVSGASISLVALAMENIYAGDSYTLTLTDIGNGTYTSSLASTWAGVYSLVASVAGTDVQTSGEVEFMVGTSAQVVVSYTSPAPASSSYSSTVTFCFTDAYGNSLPPAGVQPGISVSQGFNFENLQSNYNGSFTFKLVTNNWGTATVEIRDNVSGVSENLNVNFSPLYFETEQNLDPTSIELVPAENENGEIQVTWGENTITLKLGLFFPAVGQLGAYEMTVTYDSSALQLLGVRDWDTTDGFAAPNLTLLGENSSFMISQRGSANPGGIRLTLVDFMPQLFGKTSVSVTNTKLSTRCPMTGELRPVENVPSSEPLVAKPLKRLIVPIKKWIVEGSGITDDAARRELEKAEEVYQKAAKDCKLDYWVMFHWVINHISKDEWNKKAGADNKLTPDESKNLFKQNNWNPDDWMNIYNVPPGSLLLDGKYLIGWWWDQYDGGSGIFTDKSQDMHDRNLAHELMHEFSKSRVKDSPKDNAAAQGGRDPNNIMKYCGGGKEISSEQGKILNEEMGKRAQERSAEEGGGYIYRPGA
jgi:hypothetical protein